MFEYKNVKVGDKLKLWPKDTYPKYGVVTEVTPFGVTVEITEVDERDFTRYKPGQVLKFPWSHFRVVYDETL
ncbi:MAG: hypothetical protein LRZ91_04630 [Desulfotomaculum sp.]|nr:hypothetical protein [Desulfotomaculum sp.]MCL0032469.1 hypothetical protein [Peptococcaceae bacterium]MCL0100358.1 hypothetical protein [Peptococcaceae bacterium]MCL0107487.1 hypothetical protein [Peptococcaceae bacterium]